MLGAAGHRSILSLFAAAHHCYAVMQAGDFEAAAHDARSQRSAGGRTARRQAWAENDVFSDDSGDGGGGAPTVRTDALMFYSEGAALDPARHEPRNFIECYGAGDGSGPATHVTLVTAPGRRGICASVCGRSTRLSLAWRDVLDCLLRLGEAERMYA